MMRMIWNGLYRLSSNFQYEVRHKKLERSYICKLFNYFRSQPIPSGVATASDWSSKLGRIKQLIAFLTFFLLTFTLYFWKWQPNYQNPCKIIVFLVLLVLTMMAPQQLTLFDSIQLKSKLKHKNLMHFAIVPLASSMEFYFK